MIYLILFLVAALVFAFSLKALEYSRFGGGSRYSIAGCVAALSALGLMKASQDGWIDFILMPYVALAFVALLFFWISTIRKLKMRRSSKEGKPPKGIQGKQ